MGGAAKRVSEAPARPNPLQGDQHHAEGYRTTYHTAAVCHLPPLATRRARPGRRDGRDRRLSRRSLAPPRRRPHRRLRRISPHSAHVRSLSRHAARRGGPQRRGLGHAGPGAGAGCTDRQPPRPHRRGASRSRPVAMPTTSSLRSPGAETSRTVRSRTGSGAAMLRDLVQMERGAGA